MFALPIFMPRFKSNNFYQNNPEIKLIFQKKKQNFQALGVSPPSPRASGGWQASPQDLQWSLVAGGSAPTPPKQPLPLRISGYGSVSDYAPNV